jgi:hypothetical protein
MVSLLFRVEFLSHKRRKPGHSDYPDSILDRPLVGERRASPDISRQVEEKLVFGDGKRPLSQA